MIKITIPGNPLSDNHLYGHRAFGRRVIKYMTKKGKDYRELVKKCIINPIVSIKCPVEMHINVYFGDKRKRDIQGHLKCLIDSLQGIVYEDDSQIKLITAEKNYDKEIPRSEVIVHELEVKYDS